MIVMRKSKVIAAIAVSTLLFSLVGVQFVEVARANPIAYCTEIFIKEDGSISPTTELLARNGDTYYLTGNTTNCSFTIQRSNIVFDGKGYTIDGSVGTIGYSNRGLILTFVTNVTVKDVTVKNFWSDNIAVLSSSYCTFSNIQSNIQSIGGQPLNFQASNFNKVTKSNINQLVMSGSNNTFYSNNIYFIWKFSSPNIWDNGIVGNYWSANSGSGPYVLNSANRDNFPYSSPVDIQLPIPEPTNSPSPTVTPTPAPSTSPSLTSSPSTALSADLAESASAIYFGGRVNFTVSVEGGKAPFSYEWYFDNQSVATGDTPYFSIDFIAVGPHHVYAKVVDADSNTAKTLTVEFNVLPTSNPTPSPSLTIGPTLEPTQTPATTSEDDQTGDFTLPIILAVVIMIAVAVIALVYFKKRKRS
jgi:hypothetical protein